MQKFLALYMASPEQQQVWKDTSPEDQKKGMDVWVAWANGHKDAFVDMGDPTGKNQHIDAHGVADKGNEVCGYSIVQAPSAEAAAAIFEGSPHVNEPNAWVDLMPIVEMKME